MTAGEADRSNTHTRPRYLAGGPVAAAIIEHSILLVCIETRLESSLIARKREHEIGA